MQIANALAIALGTGLVDAAWRSRSASQSRPSQPAAARSNE
jgi:hypothetical protein